MPTHSDTAKTLGLATNAVGSNTRRVSNSGVCCKLRRLWDAPRFCELGSRCRTKWRWLGG